MKDRIKQQLEELNTYFLGKLLTEDYTVNNIDEYTVEIEIDGFPFTLWIANSASSFRCYNSNNAMLLTFTDDEKSGRKAHFTKVKLEALRSEKIGKIAELQSEINEIENEIKK